MDIYINPKYKHLNRWLQHLEEHFEDEGREIFRGVSRNHLRQVTVGDLTLWIKRYGKQKLKHRLRPWRTNMGKKAYVGPLILRERGFESPEPVAVVRYRTGLFTSRTYFVSRKMELRFTMDCFPDVDEDKKPALLEAFAQYLARLHDKGVIHTNFASKNVLFDEQEDKYRFALVDANRVKTKRKIGMKEGCANVARLTGEMPFFQALGRCYGEARGFDPEECARLMVEAHDHWEDVRKF